MREGKAIYHKRASCKKIGIKSGISVWKCSKCGRIFETGGKKTDSIDCYGV